MCNKATLDEVTGKISRAAKEVLGDKLEKVFLFGSYARGDYDEESDIDIFVLADIKPIEVDDVHIRVRDAAGYIELEYDVVTSIHFACSSIFHKFIDAMPFYRNVQREGVLLYA